MKKRNGFTLIELLVVIIIVGILLIIAIPSVSKYLKRGTDEYYKSQEKTVLLSGRDYLNDYKTLFPKAIGNVTVVSLNELLVNKYLDPVLDSNKKECDAKFTVKKVGKNQYEYYSCLICDDYKTEGDFCNYTEEDNVTPETKNYRVEVDKEYYTVEQGKTFELPYARAYYLNELVSDKVVGSPRIIDTNKLGVTVVTYSYQGAKKQIRVEVIDSVSPSIPQVVLKKENENGSIYKGGWVNSNIYALFKSTDYTKDNLNGSGVSYYEVSKDGKNWNKIDGNGYPMTEEGDYNHFVRSVDKSGNVSPANSYNVKIDKKVPTCSLKVVSGTLGKNGWYTSDVRVGFESLNDDRSGVKNSSIDIQSITYDVKNKKVTGTVVDNAGNSNTCSINVSVDKTNPRVEYSIAGGISNTNRTVVVNAIDTYFDYMNIHVYKNGTINNATNNIKNTNKSYTLEHGTWTIYIQAYDESGRKQEQNPNNGSGWYYQTYVVDTVEPTCSLKVVSGTLGKNGWYTSDVRVDFETTDGTGSNIISSFVSNSGSVTANGTTTVTGTVTDQAGNMGSCSINVKVDKNKPSCSFAGESSNWTSQNRTITAACSDATSGCSSSTSSKQWSYSSGTTKTAYLSYIMEDNAGNSATCGKTTNIYVDKEGPTTPTGGAIGNVSGSNSTGYIQTGGSGSTDTGSGNITYKYIVSTSSQTPTSNDSRFTTSTAFTRSCGSTYYAWVIAEDGVGNRSGVKYIGSTSDGANSYSEWSNCSKSCGGGTQTRTNSCALVTTGLSQSCNPQSCCPSLGKTWEYNYTGGVQTFTVPCSGTYKLEVYGAQGGGDISGAGDEFSYSRGGYGGYSKGDITLQSGNKLYICVGGAGRNTYYDRGAEDGGGYNGGGNAFPTPNNGKYNGGGGGGATHIALNVNRGVLKNYSENKSEILIVAGGGGGAMTSWGDAIGGYGGGTTGGSGIWTSDSDGLSGLYDTFGYSSPGTQDSGYGFGLAGSLGGGGWYGGYTGHVKVSGGGGSGYVNPTLSNSGTEGNVWGRNDITNVEEEPYNGKAKITLVSLSN